LSPINLYYLNDAIKITHGALIRISPGYSPVKGRLHTRYSPIRRSQETEVSLPLDLHVLGLPLAFILSQDQTLHRSLFVLLSSVYTLLSLFLYAVVQYVYDRIFFKL